MKHEPLAKQYGTTDGIKKSPVRMDIVREPGCIVSRTAPMNVHKLISLSERQVSKAML